MFLQLGSADVRGRPFVSWLSYKIGILAQMEVEVDTVEAEAQLQPTTLLEGSTSSHELLLFQLLSGS